MRAPRRLVLSAVALLLLVGCGPQGSTPVASPTAAVAPADTPTPTTLPTSLPPSEIVLWTPPDFAPTEDSPAGRLLSERLEAFRQAHPGLAVEVRIKAETGAASLLEMLTTASQAAPATLPDLVALDSESLRVAALKGLLTTLEEMSVSAESPDWYAYAEEASRVNGILFGLPFGGQTEVLAYRSDMYEAPPSTWSAILQGPPPFLFPAQDPTACFTLSLYRALGGSFYDEAGRPQLEAPLLEQVFGFFASGRANGVIPLSARQHSSASTTWPPLRDGRAQSALAPFSTFLIEYDPATDAALPLPTPDGAGVSPVNAWSFALVADDPSRQAVALELVGWLTDDDFLGAWTHALGLLPPTPGALAAWPEGTAAVLANRLVLAARLRPSAEVLATFGAVVQRNLDEVLTGEATPESAALAAFLQVRVP